MHNCDSPKRYSVSEFQEPLGAALFGCALLRELASDDRNQACEKELLDNATELEDLACDLLGHLHESAPFLAQLILLRSIPVLSGSYSKPTTHQHEARVVISDVKKMDSHIKGRTCMELARRANAKKLISVESVDQIVENMFYGQIVGPKSGRKLTGIIFLGLFLIPLLLIFPKDFLEINKKRRVMKLGDISKLV